jgi:hypothetical protein
MTTTIFFVIGFCTTERTLDCIISLAASAKGVVLSFYHGASLADSDNILPGSGKQNRFIRLESAATLSEPEGQGTDFRCRRPGANPASRNRQWLHNDQIRLREAASAAKDCNCELTEKPARP